VLGVLNNGSTLAPSFVPLLEYASLRGPCALLDSPMPVVAEKLLIEPVPVDLRLYVHEVTMGWKSVAVTQAELEARHLPRKESALLRTNQTHQLLQRRPPPARLDRHTIRPPGGTLNSRSGDHDWMGQSRSGRGEAQP
jgi:hypothetical protein